MMKYIQSNQLQTILTHTCKGDMRKSKILRVDDQTLRCMRHKKDHIYLEVKLHTAVNATKNGIRMKSIFVLFKII